MERKMEPLCNPGDTATLPWESSDERLMDCLNHRLIRHGVDYCEAYPARLAAGADNPNNEEPDVASDANVGSAISPSESSTDDILVRMFEWMIQAPRPQTMSPQSSKHSVNDAVSKPSAIEGSISCTTCPQSVLVHGGAKSKSGKKIRKKVEFRLSSSPDTTTIDKQQQCESSASNNATMSSDPASSATISDNSTTLDAHDLSGLGSEMDPPTVCLIKASGGDDSRSPGSEDVDPEITATTSCLPEEIIDSCPSRTMDRLRVAATALSQELTSRAAESKLDKDYWSIEQEIIERIQEDIFEIEEFADSCGLDAIVSIRKKFAARNGHLRRKCVAPNYRTSDVMPFVAFKQALNAIASEEMEQAINSITEDKFRKSVPCRERIPNSLSEKDSSKDGNGHHGPGNERREEKRNIRQQRKKEIERKVFKQAAKAWYDVEFNAKPQMLEAIKGVVLIEHALPKIMQAACKITHRWETCVNLQKAGTALDAYLRIARTGLGTDSTIGCMLRAMQGKRDTSGFPHAASTMDARASPDAWRKACSNASGQWYTIFTTIQAMQTRVRTWGPKEAPPKSPVDIFADDDLVIQMFPCPSEFAKLMNAAAANT